MYMQVYIYWYGYGDTCIFIHIYVYMYIYKHLLQACASSWARAPVDCLTKEERLLDLRCPRKGPHEHTCFQIARFLANRLLRGSSALCHLVHPCLNPGIGGGANA